MGDGCCCHYCGRYVCECPEEPMPLDARDLLLNLLARIHGDGGQHAGRVGIAKACEEAEAIVVALQNRSLRDVIREALGKREWPFNPRSEAWELRDRKGEEWCCIFEYEGKFVWRVHRHSGFQGASWSPAPLEGKTDTLEEAKSAALDALADIIWKELTGA